MKPDTGAFLRGSRVLQPVGHIVVVTSRNGAQHFRRVSLTAETMGKLEARLMVLKHDGHISDYLIAAAEYIDFAGVLAWVHGFAESAQQQELISIETGTLFAGGAL